MSAIKLTAAQRSKLETLSHYNNFTYVTGRPSLQVLLRLGLIEARHNGMCWETRILPAGRAALAALEASS